jgi:two-component system, LuxR family, sensor kinase FixL
VDDTTLHALRTLQLNEARWQAILDTARDAIICIDSAGNVTLFNRAAEAIFGYEASELMGQNVRKLMPSPYTEEHDEYIRRYRSTRVAKAIGQIRQVEARRKNGEIFPIELSVSEAKVGDEVIYSAIIRDMSDRRAIESELDSARRKAEQHERLADVGAITARIVHDLGNPLAGLSMQAQLILRRAKRSDMVPATSLIEPAERIVGEVRRLDHLVKDFLDFARQQRLDLREVALPPMLRHLIELWQPVAAERSIAVALELGDEVPAISVDEEKLRRVLDNLVKNAIEAIDHGPGHVAVRLAASGERIRISVEDDGPGIPQSLQLFRLFETTKPTGSGLGLSIARQIVLAHGGDLVVERLTPKGAGFYIDLPIAPRHRPSFVGEMTSH